MKQRYVDMVSLVNVHIVGGSKDLAQHLSGLTMRVPVVQRLIHILRCSGYPGYETDGINSEDNVAKRIQEVYTSKYGMAKFTPIKIQELISASFKKETSLVQDKVATPSDAAMAVSEWDRTVRPAHIVNDTSSTSQNVMHDHYANVFAKFGDFHITSGTTMVDQFVPWYIGMAFPFTMPSAVGGYDVDRRSRWRRPENDDIAVPRVPLSAWKPCAGSCSILPTEHALVGPACQVQLADLVKGLSQRIEGQFRRHWSFIPALWNLYFRERINIGGSLQVRSVAPGAGSTTSEVLDTDAAMAGASLFQKLESGHYMDRGKRRKIDFDASKLPFAEHLSRTEKQLLADFRFRTSMVPGTQEIRSKIGRVGFWASMIYGHGIFMTVSPSERHNYLALRLCRYRSEDPFVDDLHRPWISMNSPSLETQDDERMDIDIPGYDVRKLMLAEDPLAVVNAFMIQIRVLLATILGIRMCPHCPHCMPPCQDALGSVAELGGGAAGRADALFGAIECQKTTGSLHLHFFLFVQRLHQYATMKDIATLLEKGFVEAAELKDFLSNITCETYADLPKHVTNLAYLEEHWPTYPEDVQSPVGDKHLRMGRLPAFLYQYRSTLAHVVASGVQVGPNIGYATKFATAFQFFQERCQHHIHKLVNGKRIVPVACRSKTNPNECKHGAPWTNRLNTTAPLLICKGLAKKFELRCSGARNWLGQVLGLRNDAWLNGTMPALCVAFAGSTHR